MWLQDIPQAPASPLGSTPSFGKAGDGQGPEVGDLLRSSLVTDALGSVRNGHRTYP